MQAELTFVGARHRLGRWGTAARIAVGSVLIVPEAAALFYGSMALVAAVGDRGGCEITAVAYRLRGRDDQIGCPFFEPFDVRDGRR
jgi:hypothetical protein